MGNKRKFWIPLVSVLLMAAAVAGTMVLPGREPEPVAVYTAGLLGYEDFYSGSESYGLVTSDKVQTIYASTTQTVTEILVYPGQQVKKGDVLYTYDTTLSDLSLERQDLAIQQMEVNLKNAQEELKKLNAMKPMVIHENPTPEKPPVDDSDLSPDMAWLNSVISGDGTAQKPLVFWLSENTQVDETMIAKLMGSKNVVYVVFRQTIDDAAYTEYTSSYGVRFNRVVKEIIVPGETEPEESVPSTELGSENPTEEVPQPTEVKYEVSYSISFFSPEEPPVQTQPDTQIDWNSGYTQAELVAMRAEKAREIKELQFNIKMEKAELSIMRKEASDGKVYAEFDGIVTSVLEPQNALEMNEPMMKIAGGGGFYVEGSVSELELGTIQLGQSVTVSSWENGKTFQGKIVEIGRYPSENQGYTYGAANVTYYPYKVFIEESADLAEGSYVSLQYETDISVSGTFYLQNAFILVENNHSFIYVRDEDGLLEKREISAGVSTDGYMTPVYGGLSQTDLLAFPYGRDVREGAPTYEGSVDELFGY